MSEEGTSQPLHQEGELDELQVLQTLGASLKALHQMVKAVNKDLQTMSNNHEKIAEINNKWELLLEGEKERTKKGTPKSK